MNSFSAETVVVTADGDVAISEIEVGDTVLAYNEATGETGEYLVTATIAHHDPTVVYLTISGETLTTTAEHPFYTTDGEWIDAGDLTLGAEIVALDGTFGTVEAVTVAADAQPMYNLTVDTAHTFFVGDGQWLVHNVNCPRLLEIPEGAGRYQVKTLAEIPTIPGIYEFIHLKRNNLPYVGSSRNLQDRIRTHRRAGRFDNFTDVVFTPISGASHRNIEVAETIRILQVRAEVGDDIYKMANGWNDRLEQIISPYPVNPDNVPNYWVFNTNHFEEIQRLMNNKSYPWPSWLKP